MGPKNMGSKNFGSKSQVKKKFKSKISLESVIDVSRNRLLKFGDIGSVTADVSMTLSFCGGHGWVCGGGCGGVKSFPCKTQLRLG